MNDLDKQKAIRLAKELGLKVEFTDKKGVYLKYGNTERKVNWEDFFPELKTIR